jgi:cell division protein FtsN
MEIIPGLPDPHSRMVYRLQVGSYSTRELAARVSAYLKASGFDVEPPEYLVLGTRSFYRVIVPCVPAARVRAACARLGSLGFEKIWIRQ